MPSLVKALKHPHSRMRYEAAHSLGMIGPPAKDALPALKELLKDPAADVRQEAEIAIEWILEEP